MKSASKIKALIKKKGTDTIWSVRDFPHLPPHAVMKTLSRLVKSGFLRRAYKGIYYYPAQTVLGSSVPSTSALIHKILTRSKHGAIYPGGSASFQYLGLSTQVPATYTVLADSRSGKIRLGNFIVKIENRRISRWRNVNDREVAILNCLRNVKHPPDITPETVVVKILDILRNSPETAENIVKFAEYEPPRVRALVGAMTDFLGIGNTTSLRRSLNPVTKYKLGIRNALPTAAEWGIV